MEDRELIGRIRSRLAGEQCPAWLEKVNVPDWFPNLLLDMRLFGEKESGEKVPEFAFRLPQAELRALFLCHRGGRSATGGFYRLERSG